MYPHRIALRCKADKQIGRIFALHGSLNFHDGIVVVAGIDGFYDRFGMQFVPIVANFIDEFRNGSADIDRKEKGHLDIFTAARIAGSECK